MAEFPQKLAEKLQKRAAEFAMRSLDVYQGLIDFSSNDYLGLAASKTLFNRTRDVLEKHDIVTNGASGSRLLTGNSNLYLKAEHILCQFFKSEAALIFNSGYDANIGFFSSVPQRNDVILYDEYIHASIRDGIKMGNAKSYSFKHNNISDIQSKIAQIRSRFPDEDTDIYLVTEAVFSMDGDSPDLKLIARLCQEEDIRLIVDEAHAVGIFGDKGRGLVYDLELQSRTFATILTFGKAWGGHGAAILCSDQLKKYLINFARSFIYTTGLPPHSQAGIIGAYQIINSDKGTLKRKQLLENIKFFKKQILNAGLDDYFIRSNSAIQCCIIKGNQQVKKIAADLREAGIDVRPVLAPSVAVGEERLRFCLHSFNTEQEINKAIKELREKTVKSTTIL